LGVAAAVIAAVALGWLWTVAPWVAPWPVVAAGAAVLAAAVVWWGVVPGRPVDGLWALAGGVLVTVEAAWEYVGLPDSARPYRIGAWVVVFALAFFGGTRTPRSWKGCLRVGLGASVLAVAGLTVVFGVEMGQPLQATVLEADGALVRFEASKATDFLVWAVGDFWASVPALLALGTALGALASGIAGWARRR
jgi:hypothetical protein